MQQSSLCSLDDIEVIPIPRYSHDNNDLVVMESLSSLKNPIQRVFSVRASQNAVRGQHAHIHCNQLLVCLYGSITVKCTDGIRQSAIVLDTCDKAIFIPAGIWAEQIYHDVDNVLLVLCDEHFKEDDYIRDYEDYKHFRGLNSCTLG